MTNIPTTYTITGKGYNAKDTKSVPRDRYNRAYTTVNVGLAVGDSTPEGQLEKTLEALGNPTHWRVVEAGYTVDGNTFTEDTVVALLSPEVEISFLQEAANILEQDAIAVWTGVTGYMVHRDNPVNEYSFDMNYFIKY